MVDAIRTGVTLDDLMQLDPDVIAEVIDGEIVEMTGAGIEPHFYAGNVHRVLDPYVITNELGAVFMDGLIYLLNRQGQRLLGARIPDVSFVRQDHFPTDWDLSRPFPGAPALAVEVMSPDDKVEDLQLRIRDYFAAGTEEIWVAYPETREVHQHRRGVETIRIYRGDEAVDTGALFPGLRLTVDEIFALPAWVKQQ